MTRSSPPAEDRRHSRPPAPLPEGTDQDADLREAALRERLRLSIERALATLRTAPLGCAVVGWFAWGSTPHEWIFGWMGLFGIALLVDLAVLRRVARRYREVEWAFPRYLAALAIDGLSWGSLCPMVMGYNEVVDTWLITVLCGVAAVNAPVHILFRKGYGLQLIGMWLPAASHALIRFDQPNMPQMLFGITVFFALLMYYMGQLGDRIQENILLSLKTERLTRQLSDSLAQMAVQATTDALTGLPNRRAVDAELQRQHELFETSNVPYAVLMLDIDHFKQVNDVHGHAVGDEALCEFARRVAATLRPSDFLGRYGGEEFLVLLPGASAEQAAAVSQRVCDKVAEQPLLLKPRLLTTVSIGVACSLPGQGLHDVTEAADLAVYEAKRSGRNRICLAPVPPAAVQTNKSGMKSRVPGTTA